MEHYNLWKAYEGMVSVQDACSKVYSASTTVNTIRNKLSVLRDVKEPVPVKDEDIDFKIDPETEHCDALKWGFLPLAVFLTSDLF